MNQQVPAIVWIRMWAPIIHGVILEPWRLDSYIISMVKLDSRKRARYVNSKPYPLDDMVCVKEPAYVTEPEAFGGAVWISLWITELMVVPVRAHPIYRIPLPKSHAKKQSTPKWIRQSQKHRSDQIWSTLILKVIRTKQTILILKMQLKMQNWRWVGWGAPEGRGPRSRRKCTRATWGAWSSGETGSCEMTA